MRARHLLVPFLLCAALAAQNGTAPQGGQVATQRGQTFDPAAFAAWAKQKGASQAQLEAFEIAKAEGLGVAAEQLMRQVDPSYAKACELADKNAPEAALELAKLAAGSDSRQSAFAQYRLARVLLDNDDPEAAVAVLQKYIEGDGTAAPFGIDAAYYHAHALARVPVLAAAKLALETFITAYADSAPERYLAVAKQQLQELMQQGEVPLYEVADKMKSAERGLKKTDTGKPTQEKQKWALEKLEELIKIAEEQEKQQGGAPSGNQASGNPATKSATPEGAARIGELHKAPSTVDRWVILKDSERKAIESEAATKLPPQYSKMLEEYYKKLGKGSR